MKSRAVGSIAVAVLLALGTLFLALSRTACLEAIYPVDNARHIFMTRVWSRVQGIFRSSSVCAENVRLKHEISALALLPGEIERLEAENRRLRNVLGYAERNHGKWLAACVLSRGGAVEASNFLRVNKGSLAGVQPGAVVVVPEGLVGRVAAVTPHTADIQLVTDSSIKVHCEVETESRTKLRGVIAGGGEDVLRMRYLSGAGAVSPHTRVLTSGLGGVFPRGIEVGTFIGFRENGDPHLTREGEVRPPVDYLTLEDVFIRCEK